MSFSALVMAGGRGRRLGARVEKPLLSFRGRPLIAYVLGALSVEEVGRVVVAVTGQTQKTGAYVERMGYETFLTPARGYVEDLSYALRRLELGKTLTLASDLPLIRGGDVRYVLGEYLRRGCPSLAVLVEHRLYERLGLKPNASLAEGVPTGINVMDTNELGGKECYLFVNNPRLAVNVNYLEDLEKAEKILDEFRSSYQ